ncbi:hypothetical protein DMUE_0981 [Dictyocoela muelleri]|nr:hypothetical protein DMUE_0981 [Dictyocoela muelleri]
MLTRMELYNKHSTPHGLFGFCAEIGLLRSEKRCKKCIKPMTLKQKKSGDGLIWGCTTYKCHDISVSIREGSVLFGLKTPLRTILLIIYEWTQKTDLKKIKRKYKVSTCVINTVLNLIRSVLNKRKYEKI